MKAKKYEEILREVLINHLEVSCQMKADIMIAFKQNVIIEKHKIKPPIIKKCEQPVDLPIGAMYFSDETIKEVQDRVGNILKGIHLI
jgi:hypothetical protein